MVFKALIDLHFHQSNLIKDAPSLGLSLSLSHPLALIPLQQSPDYSVSLDNPVFLERFVAVDVFEEMRQAG